MRLRATYALFLLLTSCASAPQVKSVDTFVRAGSAEETYNYVRERTHNCWQKAGGFLKDGVYVTRADIDNVAAILVSRTSENIGFSYDYRQQRTPVLQILFHPLDSQQTKVEITEYTGGKKLAADVNRWVRVDPACSTSE